MVGTWDNSILLCLPQHCVVTIPDSTVTTAASYSTHSHRPSFPAPCCGCGHRVCIRESWARGKGKGPMFPPALYRAYLSPLHPCGGYEASLDCQKSVGLSQSEIDQRVCCPRDCPVLEFACSGFVKVTSARGCTKQS